MKKLLAILVATGAFAFYSCNENSVNPEIPEKEDTSGQMAQSLVGTRWVLESFIYHEGRREPEDENHKYELIFASRSEVSFIRTTKRPLGGDDKLEIYGTFKCNVNKITFSYLSVGVGDYGMLGMCHDEDSAEMTGDELMVAQIFTGGDILELAEFRKLK